MIESWKRLETWGEMLVFCLHITKKRIGAIWATRSGFWVIIFCPGNTVKSFNWINRRTLWPESYSFNFWRACLAWQLENLLPLIKLTSPLNNDFCWKTLYFPFQNMVPFFSMGTSFVHFCGGGYQQIFRFSSRSFELDEGWKWIFGGVGGIFEWFLQGFLAPKDWNGSGKLDVQKVASVLSQSCDSTRGVIERGVLEMPVPFFWGGSTLDVYITEDFFFRQFSPMISLEKIVWLGVIKKNPSSQPWILWMQVVKPGGEILQFFFMKGGRKHGSQICSRKKTGSQTFSRKVLIESKASASFSYKCTLYTCILY